MDKLIYTAMTGASHVLQRQATVSQNLSNSNTPGFRSMVNAFRAVPLVGEGLPTRTFVVDTTTGYDFTPAAMEETGRPLDIAVNGKGWITVQMPDGTEAYTRDGSLQISPQGILQTRSGLPVASDSGQIAIPPDSEITIGADGTVSTVPTGNAPSQGVTVGRIKLVNPPEKSLVRGDDGLFRVKGGAASTVQYSDVTVVPGHLEGSNVHVVETMVEMISLARQFDMQMKVLKTASDDAQQASQILNVTG